MQMADYIPRRCGGALPASISAPKASSTSAPVGTAQLVRRWILEEHERAGRSFHFSVAANPEFLREGAAIGDFMRPDRVVIGTDDEEATAILKSLYRPLYLIETPIVLTDVATAELTT